MRQHFSGASVENYEHLIPTLGNHPEDRHVLAAAVAAQASIVVTFNKRHFAGAACEPYGIDVQTPDEFLCALWQATPRLIERALGRQAAGLRNPPQTPRDVLQTLQRTVPLFAARVLAAQVF